MSETIDLTKHRPRGEDDKTLAIAPQLLIHTLWNSNLSHTVRKHGSVISKRTCAFPFVSKVLSIFPERGAVISSRCLRWPNIDSFTGGDRDLINRRLGDRGKKYFYAVSLSSGLERIHRTLSQESGLPNSFGFIKDLQLPAHAKNASSAFQILRSFNTHISALTSRQLFHMHPLQSVTHGFQNIKAVRTYVP